MDILIGFGLALVLGAIIGLLFLWLDLRNKERTATAQQQELQTKLGQLQEQMNGKRHTENSVSALEDALAVLMRLSLEEQQQALYRDAWISRAQTILQVARQSPRAYPVDQPTSSRHNRVRFDQGGQR